MARVNVAVEFDTEESDLNALLDGIAGVVQGVTGEEPMLGLQVDGEHRDPDDPATDLFS